MVAPPTKPRQERPVEARPRYDICEKCRETFNELQSDSHVCKARKRKPQPSVPERKTRTRTAPRRDGGRASKAAKGKARKGVKGKSAKGVKGKSEKAASSDRRAAADAARGEPPTTEQEGRVNATVAEGSSKIEATRDYHKANIREAGGRFDSTPLHDDHGDDSSS